MREVVEADLGTTLEATFTWFDRTPLAAASIAQVHAAQLRGEPVVVKVQRPQVAGSCARTSGRWPGSPRTSSVASIAALANPPALVELFGETIVEELDFRLEAANMLDIACALADLGQRGYVVPGLIPASSPGPRYGAAVGVQVRRRRRHARRRH